MANQLSILTGFRSPTQRLSLTAIAKQIVAYCWDLIAMLLESSALCASILIEPEYTLIPIVDGKSAKRIPGTLNHVGLSHINYSTSNPAQHIGQSIPENRTILKDIRIPLENIRRQKYNKSSRVVAEK
jgi:hypothetical protein